MGSNYGWSLVQCNVRSWELVLVESGREARYLPDKRRRRHRVKRSVIRALNWTGEIYAVEVLQTVRLQPPIHHAASGPPRGLQSLSILLPICVVMDDANI